MSIFDFFKQKGELEKVLSEDTSGEMREMFEGVVNLSDTSVKEIMIPRTDVDFLNTDDNQEELIAKITESGHSRFPVYEDSIDNVIGILYVKDIITALAHGEKIDLKKIVRKVYFIPESKKIDSLLRQFKHKHVHIAVAIDEYGGISGIVCMEDVIEEIVGDIRDEFDEPDDDITKIGDGIWICDARVDLDDIQEMLGVEFPTEEFDSLGGFVFDLFGEVPVNLEKKTWSGYDFIIQEMDGHRIQSVKIMRRMHENINSEE